MFKLKKNEQEARERLRAFWYGKSIGRPAVAVCARNNTYERQKWEGGPLTQKQCDLNPDWYAHAYRNDLFSKIYLGEAMPSVSVSYGSLLVLLAVLAGGDYEYDSYSAWIKPLENVLDKPVPKFDPECDTVKKFENCFDRLAGIVEDNGFISPPVLLDPLTTLSMLHTPENLCISILEEPEKVKKWSYDATTLYIDCYEHFYRYLGELGYTDTTTWLRAMSESRTEAVQCDFSVMLSPEMFREFVVPDVSRITAYMDRSTWHHDGEEQFKFIEMIAALPKMRAVQWVFYIKNEHPSKHIECFKRIKDLGLSLYAGVRSLDEAIYLTKALGPDGLMLDLPGFDNEKDALAAISSIESAV